MNQKQMLTECYIRLKNQYETALSSIVGPEQKQILRNLQRTMTEMERYLGDEPELYVDNTFDTGLNNLQKQQTENADLQFRSHKMWHAYKTAMSVAATDATVLITGDSGTGKEVFSNQIYQHSKRINQPFVKINCAAIPENLMESEFFGYEPGSFTGASKNGKIGIFEQANNGTLLLDEIGEMSMAMQTKLLRVLQNHEVIRIGSNKAIPVDVRIIAATNRDLEQCIEEGTFRKDLFYRLNVVPIELPALKDRKEDITTLLYHFLNKYNEKYNRHTSINVDAIQLMIDYEWPGNIRELQNIVERMVVISNNEIIDKELVASILKIDISDFDNDEAKTDSKYNLKAFLESQEKKLIIYSLQEFGSKRKTAKAMGVDHSTLVRKCQKYNIS